MLSARDRTQVVVALERRVEEQQRSLAVKTRLPPMQWKGRKGERGLSAQLHMGGQRVAEQRRRPSNENEAPSTTLERLRQQSLSGRLHRGAAEELVDEDKPSSCA